MFPFIVNEILLVLILSLMQGNRIEWLRHVSSKEIVRKDGTPERALESQLAGRTKRDWEVDECGVHGAWSWLHRPRLESSCHHDGSQWEIESERIDGILSAQFDVRPEELPATKRHFRDGEIQGFGSYRESQASGEVRIRGWVSSRFESPRREEAAVCCGCVCTCLWPDVTL